MIRRHRIHVVLSLLVISSLLILTPSLAAPRAPDRIASVLMDDTALTNDPTATEDALARVLDQHAGGIMDAHLTLDSRPTTLAHLVTAAGLRMQVTINPKVLLTLIELRTGLVTAAAPAPDDLADPLRLDRPELAGMDRQLIWISMRMETAYGDYLRGGSRQVRLRDGTALDLTAAPNAATFALQVALAELAGSRAEVETLLGPGAGTFLSTYTQLFGPPVAAAPQQVQAVAPFLGKPFAGTVAVGSFFDHDGRDSLFRRFDGATSGSYDNHQGVDYPMSSNTSVLAAASGTIVDIAINRTEGNPASWCPVAYTPVTGMQIEHVVGGITFRTVSWHLSAGAIATNPRTGQPFAVGQTINAGEVLGRSGTTGCSTGPHLHLGVLRAGLTVDPYGWCGAGPDPWTSAPNEMLWAVTMTNPAPCPPPTTAPTLTATPNPLPASAGLATTTISWSTGDGSTGQVYVAHNGGAETLMSAGASGTDSPAWLAPGSEYTFRLYAGTSHTTLLKETIVRRARSIVANPAVLPASTALGSTTLSWSTGDGSTGQVYVARDGGAETLMMEGSHGVGDPAWLAPGSEYAFRLYAGTSHTTLLRETIVRRELSLLADPNPLPASGSVGSTTLYWSTGDGTGAQVYVVRPGQPETLFAEGGYGTQDAPWIAPGGTYEFRLYAGTAHTTLLRSVTVVSPSGGAHRLSLPLLVR